MNVSRFSFSIWRISQTPLFPSTHIPACWEKGSIGEAGEQWKRGRVEAHNACRPEFRVDVRGNTLMQSSSMFWELSSGERRRNQQEKPRYFEPTFSAFLAEVYYFHHWRNPNTTSDFTGALKGGSMLSPTLERQLGYWSQGWPLGVDATPFLPSAPLSNWGCCSLAISISNPVYIDE